MVQALSSARQTGKTTKIIRWLLEVENYILIVPKQEIKYFLEKEIENIEVWKKNKLIPVNKNKIWCIHTAEKLREKMIGCEIDRIGIDNFWFFDNPKEILEVCINRLGSSKIAVVLDNDYPFTVVENLN